MATKKKSTTKKAVTKKPLSKAEYDKLFDLIGRARAHAARIANNETNAVKYVLLCAQ